MAEGEADFEEGGKVHSRIGPSSAHRWMNCPGSVALTEKLGDKARKVGIAAKEGSAAHDLLARCLTSGDEAWEHIGEVIRFEGYDFPVNAEMSDAVQIAIDWTREQVAKHPGAVVLVERRVASEDDPDAFGTSDIIIIVPGVLLIVGDFKYGIGVVVEPDDEQLRSYGQYTVETFVNLGDIDTALKGKKAKEPTFPDPHTPVELYIIQPRIPHAKGIIRKHDTDMTELFRWFHGEVLPAIKETRNPEACLKIGDWCGFCPAADHCPLLRKTTTDMNTALDPVEYSDEALDELAVKIGEIEKLGKRVDIEIFERAKKGSTFPHFKLVRKLATRVWKAGAEADLQAAFGDAIYTTPVLKTPPTIEEAFGKAKTKDIMARWAMKPDTGITIASRKDKREEYVSQIDALDKAEGNTEEIVY